ncbi:MAG: hypothetical protein ACKPEN_07445, partial [Planktothrix sp.]
LQGTKNGNQLNLNITTKIELDTQKTKETWTLTSDSLNTGRVVYQKQPCLVSQIRFAPGTIALRAYVRTIFKGSIHAKEVKT